MIGDFHYDYENDEHTYEEEKESLLQQLDETQAKNLRILIDIGTNMLALRHSIRAKGGFAAIRTPDLENRKRRIGELMHRALLASARSLETREYSDAEDKSVEEIEGVLSRMESFSMNLATVNYEMQQMLFLIG